MWTPGPGRAAGRLALGGACILALLSCGGGGDGGGGENPTPAELILVSGDSQAATVGAVAPLPLVAKVLDSRGSPMGVVRVTFTIASGGGKLSGATARQVVSDPSGLASTSEWRLGNIASENVVQASVSGLPPVLFHATGRPGSAAILVKLSGDNQSGTVNTVMPESLSVRVTDGFSNHVGSGITVTFAITSGGGSLANLSSETDTAGIAVARQWRLGTTAGPNGVQASTAGVNAFFGATGIRDQLAIVQPSGTGQAGTAGKALPVSLQVLATDQYGNPIPQVPVTWQVTGGGGTLAPSSAITDAAGLVTAPWTLGLIIGPNSATAAVSGFATMPFDATGTAFTTTDLDVGAGHSCALSPVGQAWCWGSNNHGETGQPVQFPPYVFIPTIVQSGLQLATVSAGASFSCGLTANGTAYCWGLGDAGQRGDSTVLNSVTPVAVVGNHVFDSLYAGYKHTCGLLSSGAAYCWGDGASGQIGDGQQFSRSYPVPVTGGHVFTSLALEVDGTCGMVTGGSVFCWGVAYGPVPTLVTGGITFTSIAAGGAHACGIIAGGSAYCWGDNGMGQLGNPAGGGATPVPVLGGLSFSQVAGGGSFTCGLSGTDIYCWGENDQGQLGDGSTTNSPVPVKVNGGLLFTSVHPGSSFTCGTANASVVYCWGLGSAGRLGDGTGITRGSAGAVVRPPGY